MSESDGEVAVREGLAAWSRGELDAVERLLDPDVTLRATEPGPWDCEGRDQVMTLLRLREKQGRGARSGDIEVQRLGESRFLVSGLTGEHGIATLVQLHAGKVIAMQQVATESTGPAAQAAVAAIRSGNVEALTRVLIEAPEVARVPVPGYQGRTLLHVATDWPGYLPNGPRIVRVLIERGADPNHRGGDGESGETPLHWAASSDDKDVALALLEGGADIEASGGSLGTPLDNAVGYACWHVAELLAGKGARVDKLWHAGALGRLSRIEELLLAGCDEEEISQAFWHACAASQRRAAERLLQAGADLNWTPDYADGTPLDAASGKSTRQANVVEWLTAQGASSTSAD